MSLKKIFSDQLIMLILNLNTIRLYFTTAGGKVHFCGQSCKQFTLVIYEFTVII